MTILRKNAMDLLEKMPEEKLYFLVQIMQGVNGLYGNDIKTEKDNAFKELESLRRKVTGIDFNKELESYREEKYGSKGIN